MRQRYAWNPYPTGLWAQVISIDGGIENAARRAGNRMAYEGEHHDKNFCTPAPKIGGGATSLTCCQLTRCAHKCETNDAVHPARRSRNASVVPAYCGRFDLPCSVVELQFSLSRSPSPRAHSEKFVETRDGPFCSCRQSDRRAARNWRAEKDRLHRTAEGSHTLSQPLLPLSIVMVAICLVFMPSLL